MMTYEPIPLSPPDKRQLALTPLATASSRLLRRETRTMLARPGKFTVRLESLPNVSGGTQFGYTISIRNTGRETLSDLEIAETWFCAPLPSEAVVFRLDIPPILPGEGLAILRLKVCPAVRMSILATVMARSLRVGMVYRSCHLELEGMPA